MILDINFKIYPQMLSFLVDKKTIKLQQRVPKILSFSSSYNNTFVFSYTIRPGQADGIIHIDGEGKYLFMHKYPHEINSFQMINDRQIIVMNTKRGQIDLINLQTKSIRSINHHYHFQDVIQMRIQCFAETKYFAIIEKGTYNSQQLCITYYRYEDTLKPQTCKPLYSYESKQYEWRYECPIKKGNNHSMILWFKQKQQEYISISYLDLRNPVQMQLKTMRFKNTGGEPYGIKNFNITLRSVWETKENTFMLIGQDSSKGQNNQYKPGVVNNNYIYHLAEDTMREAQFYFLDGDNYCWNDQIIDVINLGNFSVFYTYKHQEYSIVESPVYFVNNLTEEIVAEQIWKAECYYINYFIPGYLSNTMVQAYYVNGDVQEIEVSIKRILNQHQLLIVRLPQEIHHHYLHFMMHINQDFDDDLVKDAILLLHQDELL